MTMMVMLSNLLGNNRSKTICSRLKKRRRLVSWMMMMKKRICLFPNRKHPRISLCPLLYPEPWKLSLQQITCRCHRCQCQAKGRLTHHQFSRKKHSCGKRMTTKMKGLYSWRNPLKSVINNHLCRHRKVWKIICSMMTMMKRRMTSSQCKRSKHHLNFHLRRFNSNLLNCLLFNNQSNNSLLSFLP